jgi:hypothetical protein
MFIDPGKLSSRLKSSAIFGRERNKGVSGPILPAPGALPARTTTKVVLKKWGSEQKANVQKFQLRVSCLGLKNYNLATEILL